MEKLIIFGMLSIPVIIISWRSLFSLKNHGLYRFISWECIIWLTVDNIIYWFKNPICVRQIFSWIFLLYGTYLVFIAIILMRKIGKPQTSRNDGTLYQFEKTTELINTGVYKYIRHPMYGSLLFLTWGIALKNMTVLVIVISVISSVALYITARMEEKEDIAFFGDRYKEYMKHSKMFVPYII